MAGINLIVCSRYRPCSVRFHLHRFPHLLRHHVHSSATSMRFYGATAPLTPVSMRSSGSRFVQRLRSATPTIECHTSAAGFRIVVVVAAACEFILHFLTANAKTVIICRVRHCHATFTFPPPTLQITAHLLLADACFSLGISPTIGLTSSTFHPRAGDVPAAEAAADAALAAAGAVGNAVLEPRHTHHSLPSRHACSGNITCITCSRVHADCRNEVASESWRCFRQRRVRRGQGGEFDAEFLFDK